MKTHIMAHDMSSINTMCLGHYCTQNPHLKNLPLSAYAKGNDKILNTFHLISFLQVVDGEGHPEFEKVISAFRKIAYRNMKAPYDEDIDLDPSKLLPGDSILYLH